MQKSMENYNSMFNKKNVHHLQIIAYIIYKYI